MKRFPFVVLVSTLVAIAGQLLAGSLQATFPVSPPKASSPALYPVESTRPVALPAAHSISQKPSSIPNEPKIFSPLGRSAPSTAPNPSEQLEQVIGGQLRALMEGDTSLAYYAYSSSDFKKVVSLVAFKQFFSVNRILTLQTKIDLEKPTFDGPLAKVKGKLMGGTDVLPVEYELIQEDGAWKIYRFEIFRSQ